MADPHELFDVVDEEDRVVDTRPRSEVHRLRLRHRAVHVFLFGTDGRLLIHRRSDDKEEFPGVWTSSASGHVSAGEDYDASAVRELKEELGVTTRLTRLHKFAACPETCNEFTVLYSAVSDDSVTADPEEITAVKRLAVAEICKWLQHSPQNFSPAFQLLFHWHVRHHDPDAT